MTVADMIFSPDVVVVDQKSRKLVASSSCEVGIAYPLSYINILTLRISLVRNVVKKRNS